MPMDLPLCRATRPGSLASLCVFLLCLPAVWLPSVNAQHGQGGDGRKAGDEPAVQEPRGLQDDPAATQALLDTFRLPEGYGLKLVASEPHFENPVAFDIGPDGRFYVVETHRLRAGVIDMRDHRSWVLEDLANRTVEDRVRSIEKHFQGSLDQWLTEFERVRTLSDTDGDGVVDRSVTLEEKAFGGYASGVAAGVLRVGDSVYTTNIPGLFRSIDADGDGVAERTELLHDGFGVHFSLIGHDMHGLILGPDRRLYFSIGDRGFSVERDDGVVFDFPDEGAVLRCELDGSDLQVVHRGLRNPQELAFDDHGNLFTGDNNSDSVDRARLVLIQPGADSGWRIGHQWLRDRGEWVQEGLWKPAHAGQPAFLLPPIENIGHGPSGIAFDPGGTLPAPYAGRLFWCDFRGNARSSKILSIELEEKGSAFEVTDVTPFLENTLATDICFEPDGDIVVSDWVRGWGKTGKGRLHRVTAPPDSVQSPWDEGRYRSEQVLARDPSSFETRELVVLLGHDDRRARLAAQFGLVDRRALTELQQVATGSPGSRDSDLLPRLHAVWGLGLIARGNDRDLRSRSLETLRSLLAETSGNDRPSGKDGASGFDRASSKVRGQAARMLGDARDLAAFEGLVLALDDEDPHVQREALHALAALRDARAVEQVAAFVIRTSEAGTFDPWLRHAAALALARCDDGPRDDGQRDAHDATLMATQDHPSAAVRLTSVLALRQRRSVGVAAFLDDIDPAIAAAAARAIHALRLESAAPFLADLLDRPEVADEPILWRAIEACRRLGGRQHLESLCAFVTRTDVPGPMRRRAIRAIATFLEPDPQDDVDGLVREFAPRSRLVTHGLLLRNAEAMVRNLPDGLARQVIELCENYGIDAIGPVFESIARDVERPAAVRARAVEAFARTQTTDTNSAVALADAIPAAAEPELVRAVVFLLSRQGIGAGTDRLATLARSERIEDQRFAVSALADLQTDNARATLGALLEELPSLEDALGAARLAEAEAVASASAQAEEPSADVVGGGGGDAPGTTRRATRGQHRHRRPCCRITRSSTRTCSPPVCGPAARRRLSPNRGSEPPRLRTTHSPRSRPCWSAATRRPAGACSRPTRPVSASGATRSTVRAEAPARR